MNWRKRFSKISSLSQLRTDESNFFHSINEDGKKLFFEKIMLKTEKVYYWTILFDKNYCYGVITHLNNALIDFNKFCKRDIALGITDAMLY